MHAYIYRVGVYSVNWCLDLLVETHMFFSLEHCVHTVSTELEKQESLPLLHMVILRAPYII